LDIDNKIGVHYSVTAFTHTEDKAMLRSNLSAEWGLAKQSGAVWYRSFLYSGQQDDTSTLFWKTKAINLWGEAPYGLSVSIF
jgi:hypothetical protein